jgi:hypothetical protein
MKTINKINKINELCLQIQDKQLATVFVRYAGHTDQIDVTLYPGEWAADYNDKEIIYKTIYCYNQDKTHNDLQFLKLINYLQSIIITGIIEKP